MVAPSISTIALPRILRIGGGASRQLPELLATLGLSRPFLVSDAFLEQSGMLEPILSGLAAAEIAARVFTGTVPDPTSASIDAGLEALRGGEHDCVVGFGGGSAMDLAKLVAVLVTIAATSSGVDKGVRIISELNLWAAAALVLGGVAFKGLTQKTTAYCAELDSSVGLFTGSKVAQFGYPIGEITKITPNGKTTRIDFDLPADRKLPTNVGVVAVAAGREGDAVQLRDGRTGELPEGVHLGVLHALPLLRLLSPDITVQPADRSVPTTIFAERGCARDAGARQRPRSADGSGPVCLTWEESASRNTKPLPRQRTGTASGKHEVPGRASGQGQLLGNMKSLAAPADRDWWAILGLNQ